MGAKSRSLRRLVVVTLGLLALATPAVAQEGESSVASPWRLTSLAGVGVREVSAELHAAPLLGFSGSRPESEKVELGVEAFVLLPNEVVVSPSPIFVPYDGGRGGTTQLSTKDLNVAVLFRVNYWLTSSKVRPYLAVGGGIHAFRRKETGTRTIQDVPGEQDRVIVIEKREGGVGLSTLFAVGVDIPIADRWSVRPEARVPIPTPYVTVHTLGIVLGVAYAR